MVIEIKSISQQKETLCFIPFNSHYFKVKFLQILLKNYYALFEFFNVARIK